MITVMDSAERLEEISGERLWGRVRAWKGTHIEDWTEKNMPSRWPKENCLGVHVDMVVVGLWSKERSPPLKGRFYVWTVYHWQR